jgi:hypothetical protein
MQRTVPIVVALTLLTSASGCYGPGWYQGAGDIPGVAVSDYAFFEFCGTVSQLFQFSPRQVESSAYEALGDMGFSLAEPPAHLPSGETVIYARTLDGRPTKLQIIPQNSLTRVKVGIGPIHLGDKDLSNQLLRRIALNFGAGLRAYTPIDPTLPKRLGGATTRFSPEQQPRLPEELKGEGLRPNENRDQRLTTEEAAQAAQDSNQALSLPAVLQGLMQGAAVGPAGPNIPYVPFPIPNPNFPENP